VPDKRMVDDMLTRATDKDLLEVLVIQPPLLPGAVAAALDRGYVAAQTTAWKAAQQIAATITLQGETVNGKFVRGAEASAQYLAGEQEHIFGAKAPKRKKSGPTGQPAWPILEDKGGVKRPAKGRKENTEAMLKHHSITVKYNVLTGLQEVEVAGLEVAAEREQNFTFAYLRELGRSYDLGLTCEILEEHLELLMKPYNPVADWIDSKPWDGVDRVNELLGTLTLAPNQDGQFSGLLIVRWLTNVVAAGLLPVNPSGKLGVVPGGVLVLAGAQGVGKTRWFSSLFPAESGWFSGGLSIDPSDKDSVMKVCRHWVVELGELDSTFRRSDISALKAWIDSPKDTYRRPFDRREEVHPRRTISAGTVNGSKFLMDDTGNRRYWTLSVTSCNADHGIDTQQLWAQVAHMYRVDKLPTWLDEDEKKKLAETNSVFEAEEPIGEEFAEFWRVDPTLKARVSTAQIKRDMRGDKQWSAGDTRSLGRYLRHRLGLKDVMVNGQSLWAVIPSVNRAGLANLAPLPDGAAEAML